MSMEIWDQNGGTLNHLYCDTILLNNAELIYTKTSEPKIYNIRKKLENYTKALNPPLPNFEEFDKNYDQLKCLANGQGSHFTVYTIPIDM